MTISEKIATFVRNLNLQKLSKANISMAKYCLLDYIGVTIASRNDPNWERFITYATRKRGDRTSTIIGSEVKTSPEDACLINGSMGHLLDFDDAILSYLGHPSVVIYPPLLAVCERYAFSGSRMVEAFIAGVEAATNIASLCMPSHYQIGWHSTSTLGSFSAAAAMSKLLRLKPDTIASALGLTASLASGIRENFGTLTKPFHAGRAAQNGLVAVLWAQGGINASLTAFEGQNGFLKCYGGKEGEPFPSRIAVKVSNALTKGIYFKRYPSCTETHPAIDAALRLVDIHHVSPERIKKIDCFTTQQVLDQIILALPDSGAAGRFSIPFCIANAFLYREVDLSHFSEKNVKSQRVRGIMEKCKVFLGPALKDELYGESSETHLKITMVDGSVLGQGVEFAKGDPRNPLGEDELLKKFQKCCDPYMKRQTADLLADTILNVEKLVDVGKLMDLLTPRKRLWRG